MTTNPNDSIVPCDDSVVIEILRRNISEQGSLHNPYEGVVGKPLHIGISI